MCGKEIYKSRTQATIAVKTFRETSGKHRTHKTYYCHECDAYHTTSNRTKRKKPFLDKIEVRTKHHPNQMEHEKNLKTLRIVDYTGKKYKYENK